MKKDVFFETHLYSVKLSLDENYEDLLDLMLQKERTEPEKDPLQIKWNYR